jgi:hypothetical protein
MPVTFNIPVGLAVFKALTAMLEEGQTHDDVLRELLQLDSPAEPEKANPFAHLEDISVHVARGIGGAASGFHSRGLWLPNGTQLRARYKGKLFEARIASGKWMDSAGKEHSSPSAAATAITSTNVNGLRFWEAKRPTDSGWRRLEAFVEDKR